MNRTELRSEHGPKQREGIPRAVNRLGEYNSRVTEQQGIVWRLLDVLQESTTFLRSHGVENPRLDAERLLASVLECTRVGLYLAFDRPLTQAERDRFKTLLRRRSNREPLQYILGETEFMSLPFRVTPDVLIPRPETEVLVERTVEEARGAGAVRILDVGSGSGALGISLARDLPAAEVVCVDISAKALAVSQENAERNGVFERMRFIRADLTDGSFAGLVGSPFAFVVSNPPYVSSAEWETLAPEIRNFEPKVALVAGADGLDCLRVLSLRTGELLLPGGTMITEIGRGQGKAVAALLERAGFEGIHIYQDLNGIDRVVRGKLRMGLAAVESREPIPV